MNCAICREPLDPVLESSGTHPTCFPFAEAKDDGDPFENRLKAKLIDVILWAERQNPRGHQVALGPSELGSPCDRRIGYRLAGVQPVNTEFDPWPMIMGTAVHSWLDESFTKWDRARNSSMWLTETTLYLDDFVEGHADLYSREDETVIDWKGVGPDVLKKIRKDGVPIGYQIQTHLYGYGFVLKGLPVKKVCLAFLPRAGWLRDMYLWCQDYDENVAVGAILRMYQIATQVMELETSIHSHRWEQVEAFPSNDCGWCPFYAPGRDSEQGASDQGCPGR